MAASIRIKIIISKPSVRLYHILFRKIENYFITSIVGNKHKSYGFFFSPSNKPYFLNQQSKTKQLGHCFDFQDVIKYKA